jgi:hypothetical protein
MRELSVNEVGFVSGGLIGAPPGPYLSVGSSGSSGSNSSIGCNQKNPWARLGCELTRDGVIMAAVDEAISWVGRVGDAMRDEMRDGRTVGVPGQDWPGAGAPPGGVPAPGRGGGHVTGP